MLALMRSLCCLLMIKVAWLNLKICKLFVIMLSNWFSANWLAFNVTKIRFILFTLNKILRFRMLNFIVVLLNTLKYFNVCDNCNIDGKLNWQPHCNYLCKKLAQVIALLKSIHTLYPIYCKRICCILHLCILIWLIALLNGEMPPKSHASQI